MSERPLLPGADGYIDDPTDHDYAVAAEWALRNKKLAIAMEQVSGAIAKRPLHAPHRQLLDRIADKSKAPLLLLKDKAFFGCHAARAHLLARRKRLDDAIGALFIAVHASPSTPFLAWLDEWVKEPSAARDVTPERLAAAIVAFESRVQEAALDAGLVHNLSAACAAAERLAKVRPSAHLLVAASRMLRLLGESTRALERLRSAPPTWETLVEEAAVQREIGDREGERRALEAARDRRPEERSTYLDLGDCLVALGNLEEAIAAYRETPDGATAMAYAQALLSNTRELKGDTRLHADLSAYWSWLPPPVDPLCKVIDDVARRKDGPITARVRADLPACPSARLAFRFALGERSGELQVIADETNVRWGPLWEPGMTRPRDDVIERVATLARTPFTWSRWCEQAAELAAGCHAIELVHALAHPPPPAEDPVSWVHGFQVAGALMIAACADPLPSLKGLFSDDWSSAAAILGLRVLAERGAAVVELLAPLLPRSDAPLPPHARALAIVGSERSEGELRRAFLRLRARVLADS